MAEKYMSLASEALRIDRLEAALREIAVGLTEEDNVADYHNRYQMCASRLCKLARDALRATVDGSGGT